MVENLKNSSEMIDAAYQDARQVWERVPEMRAWRHRRTGEVRTDIELARQVTQFGNGLARAFGLDGLVTSTYEHSA